MSVHRVWKFGPDIDTDALAPGAYMKLGIEGIAPHCLEAVHWWWLNLVAMDGYMLYYSPK